MNEPMFHRETIFLDVDANSTEQLLDVLGKKMFDLGYVTPEFREAVKIRERDFPTGLPGPICDIAVPHTDPEYVKKPFIAVVRTVECIPFIQMATKDQYLKSRLIFMLGFKTGQYQVKVLQVLINRFIKEKKLAQIFLKENNIDKCYILLQELEREVLEKTRNP